ncbi:MAG: PP2C family protein-serine/threonine phosphatase, partial [Oscillospiraceae bacterium]
MLYIDTASYTGCGGHEINEDSFCCAADFFAVADGLGGHINGEEASRCAIGYLKKNAHGDYSEDNVKRLLEGANSAVFRQAKGAKTTIAVLFAENGVFRYANVGDSRVYIFRNDRLLAMTKDHSVCRAAVDMGTMKFDEIRRSEDRSKLLKVLGNDDKLNVPKGYPPIQMQEGDAFLICSDGFWDYVLESEMEADLLKSDSPKKWLNYMLKRHIAAAMNKGDNYTAICGMVRAEQNP